jgi:hypothetical protein
VNRTSRALGLVLAGAATLAIPATADAKVRHRPAPRVDYVFWGNVVTDPGAGAKQLTFTATSGNARALRVMLGQKQPLTLSLGPRTRYIVWNGHQPVVGTSASLVAGDRVRIVVRARRGVRFARIAAIPAARVGDYTAFGKVPGALFLYRGVVKSADASHVTIRVRGGNARGLRLLIGHPRTQTFTFGSTTTFVDWVGGLPRVVDATTLHAGERVVIRIRAPRASSLATVESTPAVFVNTHEPAPKA